MATAQDSDTILRPGASGGGQSLTKVGFGTTEIQTPRETQGSALAARAQAEVQSRYIMALQRPRNVEQFRIRLLDHCRRPGFAEAASYAKPVGGETVRGPSIRFVETALQEFGNVLPEETITYDDDLKRVTLVAVTDLERNVTYKGDVIVEKTVERRNPRDGDEVLGSRVNSTGQTVFKIRADEDAFATKCAAACAKKLRNLGLKIIPADIVSDAAKACNETRNNETAKDPAAARRGVADAFASVRVMPSDLDAYLGHPFDQASPAELDELRAAFVAVRDGEARWVDIVESQRGVRGEVEKVNKPAKAAGDLLRKKIDEVRAKQKTASSEPKTAPVVDVKEAATPVTAAAAEAKEPSADEQRDIAARERSEGIT